MRLYFLLTFVGGVSCSNPTDDVPFCKDEPCICTKGWWGRHCDYRKFISVHVCVV